MDDGCPSVHGQKKKKKVCRQFGEEIKKPLATTRAEQTRVRSGTSQKETHYAMSKVGLKCRKVHHRTVGNNSLIINPEDGAPFPPPLHRCAPYPSWQSMACHVFHGWTPSYKCVVAL